MRQIFLPWFPKCTNIPEGTRQEKEKNLEGAESQLAASTALVYMLDAKDFRNRSWLADMHTKKKRSGHKLQVSG